MNLTKKKQAEGFPNTEYYILAHQKFLYTCRRKKKASIKDPPKIYHLDSKGVLSFQDR